MKLITDIDPLVSDIPLSRAGEFDTITKQFSDQCALTVRQRDGLLRLLYQSYLAGDEDRIEKDMNNIAMMGILEYEKGFSKGYEEGYDEGRSKGYDEGSANA